MGTRRAIKSTIEPKVKERLKLLTSLFCQYYQLYESYCFSRKDNFLIPEDGDSFGESTHRSVYPLSIYSVSAAKAQKHISSSIDNPAATAPLE